MNTPLNPVQGVDESFLLILGVSAVLLLGIIVVMIAFLVRYRSSRHPVAVQISGHFGLEALWIIAPSFIAAGLFWHGWQSYLGLRTVPENAMIVRVTAEQFGWNFVYESGKTVRDCLTVPQGRPVKLLVTSADVLHSFYAPAYRIKIDAMPKKETYAWFLPEKLGSSDVYCALYCGVGHADMMAKIEVVTPPEFEDFLSSSTEEEW